MLQEIDLLSVIRWAICFLYMGLFWTATIDKFKSPAAPDWFIKQFSNTIIAKLPGGSKRAYWKIAIFELSLALAFTASVFMPVILIYSLVAALFLFASLLIGLRLTFDFQGSANMFCYFGATLLAIMYLQK